MSATRSSVSSTSQPSRGNDSLTPAVGYIRMSTDMQDKSPQEQQEEITSYAKTRGYRIVRFYKDEGISGFEENREQFQVMVNDVQTVRDFDAIIVWNQKRFARFDFLKTAKYWEILRDAEMRLISICEGEIGFDNIGEILKAVVNQDAAYQYLRDISREILRSQIAAVKGGYWPNGRAPYGYAIVPANDGSGRCRLAIDEERAVVVRRVFNEYVYSGRTRRQIADGLNRDGYKTSRKGRWLPNSVRDVLTNEAYIGTLIRGRKPIGKHWRLVSGERVEVKRRGAAVQRTSRDQWMIVENAHPAIVDCSVFQQAARLIASRNLRKVKGPTRKRSFVSGLCRCGHCGTPLGLKNCSETFKGFMCSQARAASDKKPECRYCVSVQAVGEAVLERVEQDYLSDSAISRFQQAITSFLLGQREQGSGNRARLDKQMAAVRTKLAKAEGRLLDVPDDMAAALYRQIRELRENEQQIQADLTAQSRLGEISEKTIAEQGRALIGRLRDIRAALATGDIDKMRAHLELIVESITVWTRPITKRKPGQSNAARRELARIDIRYRNPICVYEDTTINTALNANWQIARKSGVLAGLESLWLAE